MSEALAALVSLSLSLPLSLSLSLCVCVCVCVSLSSSFAGSWIVRLQGVLVVVGEAVVPSGYVRARAIIPAGTVHIRWTTTC